MRRLQPTEPWLRPAVVIALTLGSACFGDAPAVPPTGTQTGATTADGPTSLGPDDTTDDGTTQGPDATSLDGTGSTDAPTADGSSSSGGGGLSTSRLFQHDAAAELYDVATGPEAVFAVGTLGSPGQLDAFVSRLGPVAQSGQLFVTPDDDILVAATISGPNLVAAGVSRPQAAEPTAGLLVSAPLTLAGLITEHFTASDVTPVEFSAVAPAEDVVVVAGSFDDRSQVLIATIPPGNDAVTAVAYAPNSMAGTVEVTALLVDAVTEDRWVLANYAAQSATMLQETILLRFDASLNIADAWTLSATDSNLWLIDAARSQNGFWLAGRSGLDGVVVDFPVPFDPPAVESATFNALPIRGLQFVDTRLWVAGDDGGTSEIGPRMGLGFVPASFPGLGYASARPIPLDAQGDALVVGANVGMGYSILNLTEMVPLGICNGEPLGMPSEANATPLEVIATGVRAPVATTVNLNRGMARGSVQENNPEPVDACPE